MIISIFIMHEVIHFNIFKWFIFGTFYSISLKQKLFIIHFYLNIICSFEYERMSLIDIYINHH